MCMCVCVPVCIYTYICIYIYIYMYVYMALDQNNLHNCISQIWINLTSHNILYDVRTCTNRSKFGL